MSSRLRLEVVTPTRRMLSEEVEEVSYRAAAGYVGILPGHVPMLTSLEIGELAYRVGGTLHYVAVSRGFVEVLPDRVTVLADCAQGADEIDTEKVKATKAEAEARLDQHTEEHEFLVEMATIEDAMAKLSVAARRR